MVYNEATTTAKIQALKVKIVQSQTQLREYNSLLTSLMNIQDVEFIDIIDNKKVKKTSKPIDSSTGSEISDSRRDEIFDAVIPKIDNIVK